MSSTLLKFLAIASVITVISTVISNFPDVQALPSFVTDGIDWLVSGFYILDPIFPVPIFFVIVHLMITTFFYALALKVALIAGGWALK